MLNSVSFILPYTGFVLAFNIEREMYYSFSSFFDAVFYRYSKDNQYSSINKIDFFITNSQNTDNDNCDNKLFFDTSDKYWSGNLISTIESLIWKCIPGNKCALHGGIVLDADICLMMLGRSGRGKTSCLYDASTFLDLMFWEDEMIIFSDEAIYGTLLPQRKRNIELGSIQCTMENENRYLVTPKNSFYKTNIDVRKFIIIEPFYSSENSNLYKIVPQNERYHVLLNNIKNTNSIEDTYKTICSISKKAYMYRMNYSDSMHSTEMIREILNSHNYN